MGRLTEDTIRTAGSETVRDVVPAGYVFDDTAPATATENKVDNARITEYKAVHVNIRNASGTELGTSADPVEVTLRSAAGTELGVAADPVCTAQTSAGGTDHYGALTLTAIATGSTDEAGLAAAANTRLFGVAVRETAGATATGVIEHGTQNSDPMIIGVSLAANGVDFHWFGDHGIPVASGVWIERLTGSFAVTLYSRVIA